MSIKDSRGTDFQEGDKMKVINLHLTNSVEGIEDKIHKSQLSVGNMLFEKNLK